MLYCKLLLLLLFKFLIFYLFLKGWPMKKYILFKPSRYYLSCVCVLVLAIIFNLCLFFLYDAKYCESTIVPSRLNNANMKRILDNYQIFKEIITRVLPLIILIISNVILICIVKNRDRNSRRDATIANHNINNKDKFKNWLCFCFQNRSDLSTQRQQSNQASKSSSSKPKRKVNNQDNQLTLMTICVAILYTASTIPMVFAFPNLIFKDLQLSSPIYKTYAAWSNILELIQCSFRSIIYVCFTTQFREALIKMFVTKQANEVNNRLPSTRNRQSYIANNKNNINNTLKSNNNNEIIELLPVEELK